MVQVRRRAQVQPALQTRRCDGCSPPLPHGSALCGADASSKRHKAGQTVQHTHTQQSEDRGIGGRTVAHCLLCSALGLRLCFAAADRDRRHDAAASSSSSHRPSHGSSATAASASAHKPNKADVSRLSKQYIPTGDAARCGQQTSAYSTTAANVTGHDAFTPLAVMPIKRAAARIASRCNRSFCRSLLLCLSSSLSLLCSLLSALPASAVPQRSPNPSSYATCNTRITCPTFLSSQSYFESTCRPTD